MLTKEYYSLPYVSNSALKWFKKSPLYCYKLMNNELEVEDKSYMSLGRQIHMAILEPEEFDKNYIVLDFNKPTNKQQEGFCQDYVEHIKSFNMSEEEATTEAYTRNYAVKSLKTIASNANRLREELKDYINYLLVRDSYKDVINTSKYNLIQTIKNNIAEHKKANLLFSNQKNAFNEFPIVWDAPITVEGDPLKCKSLIDRVIFDHENKEITLIDLKTSFDYEEFLNSHSKYDYTHQMAFYWMAIRSYFTENYTDFNFEDYKQNTYIVVVTTNPNLVECRVIEIKVEDLKESTAEIINELIQINWHIYTKMWEHTREYYVGDGVEHI